MRIRIPPKKVCEKFFLIYELEGCQKAVDFLYRHYGIRRMRIVLDGRKVVRRARGCYFEKAAYFPKRGLNKRFVLHEFYHHLVETKASDMPNVVEERNARNYAREFLRSRYSTRYILLTLSSSVSLVL